MAELAYSVVETAKRLGCSKNTVYAMVEQNRIPHCWLTEHRVIIPKTALEKWLEASFYNVSQAPPKVATIARPPHNQIRAAASTNNFVLKPGCGGRKHRQEAR
jgi:excisionase family DNA binding protein